MSNQLQHLTRANQARNGGHYEQARELYTSYLRDYGNNADVMWAWQRYIMK